MVTSLHDDKVIVLFFHLLELASYEITCPVHQEHLGMIYHLLIELMMWFLV